MRNFFGYSLMKACPVTVQSILYDNGNYNRSTVQTEEENFVEQTITSPHTATAHALIAIAETLLAANVHCTCQFDDIESLRWCAVHGAHERGVQ